jgi:hypothetical protein
MFNKQNVKFPCKKRWVALACLVYVTVVGLIIAGIVWIAKSVWVAV